MMALLLAATALLTCCASTGQTPAPPAAEDFQAALKLPWQQVFSDTCTGDWREFWFLDGRQSKLENTPDGMILAAGPEGGGDAANTVLWTHQSFAGDVKIEYDFTRLDDLPRFVNILYIQATGVGEGPFARDIAQWSELRRDPAMKLYYNHMNLLHISYATFDPQNDYIRARRYPRPKDGNFEFDTRIPPDYANSGLFQVGVTYRITCIKRGRQLFFNVSQGGDQHLFTFNADGFPPVDEGRIGLRQMRGRVSRYANFSISILPR
ncbi:MAG: DUF1961 family protein [Phycisphaeraceae bacterium]|nr:DUF1961 family protein [Phycisphaeraceae bacterium]